MSATSKKRSRFFIISLNVLVVLILLVIAELFVRYFAAESFLNPEEIKEISLRYEACIFARHVLTREEISARGMREREYFINDKGYRGRPFQTKKPKGVIRIIFYGGSQVFDSPATLGRDWPHRVQALLKRSGFSNVEVINAGVPGHASFDAVGRLFSEGHIFQPDYVVLCNAWNDIKYFRSREPLLRQFKPYNASKDPRISYQNTLDRFMGERSQIYLRLRNRYYKWKMNLDVEGSNPQGRLESKIAPEALDQYRLNLEMFVDAARNIGAVPILVTQPRLVTATNTPEQKKRIAYGMQLLTHEALLDAFRKTDETIFEVAEKKGVKVVDASAEMTGRDDYMWDHVHFWERGSQKMARLIAGELMELLKNSPAGRESP